MFSNHTYIISLNSYIFHVGIIIKVLICIVLIPGETKYIAFAVMPDLGKIITEYR